MSTTIHPTLARRTRLSRGLYAASALFLAFAVAIAIAQPAHAASDGTDWGAQGTLSSDSAVTVTWDDSGNTGSAAEKAANTVGRETSVLPHTGGKHYADVPSAVSNAVQDAFAGMKLTVSQTEQLTHQDISVSMTGVSGGLGGFNKTGSTFVQLFQCWGRDGDAAPDPTHCQEGVGGADTQSKGRSRNIDTGDQKLIADGDLKTVVQVALTGALIGTSATLTATVNAQSKVATGVKGTVEFDKEDGTVLQKAVPVVNGVATTTIAGLDRAGAYDFVAKYTATPDENFAGNSSPALAVPPSWDRGGNSAVPAGSVNIISYPAGTFGNNKAVTTSLDGGAPVAAGTTTAFGGIDLRYVVPATLAVGSQHTLVVSDGTTTARAVRFNIPTPPAPASGGVGANVPNKTGDVPFEAVDGAIVSGILNSYYSSDTTNEVAEFEAAKATDGTATRRFEVQTGAEAPGLGCGYRTDQASTNTCWLVAVPRGYSGDDVTASPLTPSRWAQRVQVRLSFQDVAASCASGQARLLAAGSELLAPAMASWVPSLCAKQSTAVGYTTVGDPQARQQYTDGSQSLIFTSGAVDDSAGGTRTLYAPVALSGVTIAFQLYEGYSGKLIPAIKLNARLVTKLLTESYYTAVDEHGLQAQKAPWVNDQIWDLTQDPEFLALNPGVPHGTDASYPSAADLVVSSTQADAVTLLWNWLVNDHDAKAFLDGCPDEASNGSVINPFYSTRSYAECADQKTALEADAAGKRAATTTPANYTDAPQVYPPTGAVFPQPGYYERDGVTNPDAPQNDVSPLQLPDLHPRDTSLTAVGLDVARGIERTAGTWCPYYTDASCTTGPGSPGKWSTLATAHYDASVLGVTQAPTAAQYQLTTAQLCDDSGNCAAADSASLLKTASTFTNVGTGVATIPTAPDIKAGAYPLTLPVYGEVNTDGLSAANAKTIATVLDTISTTGQKPGFAPGTLPVGYAPLPNAMVAQTKATVAALRAITDQAASTPTTQDSPTDTGASLPDDSSPQTLSVPQSQTVPAISPASDQGKGAVKNPAALALVGTTPRTHFGFPQLGIAGGLIGSVLSGVAAPIVGRKRREDVL